MDPWQNSRDEDAPTIFSPPTFVKTFLAVVKFRDKMTNFFMFPFL